MKRRIGILIFLSLLMGGAILTAIRWRAWFSMPPEPIWNGDTISLRLKMGDDSVCAGLQKDTIRFLLLGDIHSSMDSIAYRTIAQRHPEADFWAQLGDWDERPYFYYRQERARAIAGSGLDTLPVWTVPGNHEYTKGIRFQRNGLDSYCVDFPTLRLVGINTAGLQWLGDYTRINVWTKRMLWHDSVDRMRVVMMHHPVYSTAKGRQNPLIWLTFARSLNRADLVFSGHDHNYVRQSVWHPGAILRDMHPTVYIATNASQKQYPCKLNSNYDCSLTGEPVYEWVEVSPKQVYVRTLRMSDGAVVDSVVITRTLP